MNAVYLRFSPKICSKRAHAVGRVLREEEMGLIPGWVREKEGCLSSLSQVLTLPCCGLY